MSEAERERWDARYGSGEYLPQRLHSPFLELAARLVPPGRALVLAAGAGRNALWLAEQGFGVDAIDVSDVAVTAGRAESDRRGLKVRWVVADLDDHPLAPAEYDLVTMIRYVNRGLWSRAVEAAKPDGWLLVEQHMRTPADVDGPQSDEYRVAPGELLQAFGALRIIHYSEGLEPSRTPGRRVAVARMLACRGDAGW